MTEAPTPELAATIGDLLARLGDRKSAEAMYAEAESLEREGWKMEEPQPAALAQPPGRPLSLRPRTADVPVVGAPG